MSGHFTRFFCMKQVVSQEKIFVPLARNKSSTSMKQKFLPVETVVSSRQYCKIVLTLILHRIIHWTDSYPHYKITEAVPKQSETASSHKLSCCSFYFRFRNFHTIARTAPRTSTASAVKAMASVTCSDFGSKRNSTVCFPAGTFMARRT